LVDWLKGSNSGLAFFVAVGFRPLRIRRTLPTFPLWRCVEKCINFLHITQTLKKRKKRKKI